MITSFRGLYSFLSNFYPVEIKFKNEVYPSVEHAFQAAKCEKECDRKNILAAATATTAKFLGRSVQMRSRWDLEKYAVMEILLRKKFNQPKMRKLLKMTSTRQIIERNHWHDVYWGVCSCERHKNRGENMMGVLLMKIRSELE